MSHCVVQGCSNSSNPATGISLHWSLANKGREMESFRLLTRKKFNPKGQVMVCSEHFNEDCFKRLFHMKGNVRLEPGSIPTVWQKTEISVNQLLSHRVLLLFQQNCVRVIFPVH